MSRRKKLILSQEKMRKIEKAMNDSVKDLKSVDVSHIELKDAPPAKSLKAKSLPK